VDKGGCYGTEPGRLNAGQNQIKLTLKAPKMVDGVV